MNGPSISKQVSVLVASSDRTLGALVQVIQVQVTHCSKASGQRGNGPRWAVSIQRKACHFAVMPFYIHSKVPGMPKEAFPTPHC